MAGARRHPWSTLPGGGAAVQVGGSLARSDACGCPASGERGRCGPDCGAGRRTQHLNGERGKKKGFVIMRPNTSVQDKHGATMYPEIIKQLSAQPLKPHKACVLIGEGLNHTRAFLHCDSLSSLVKSKQKINVLKVNG